MTTQTRPPARPSHKPKKRGINAALAHQRRVRTMWIAGGIVAIVAVAAVLAVAFGGGGDDKGIDETRPVTVTGDALVDYDRAGGPDGAVGLPAPRVSGTSFDGASNTIEPGRPTMVVFLAHWCGVCQAEVPRLVEWYGQGHVPAGLNVIAVATAIDKAQGNYPPSSWLTRERWPWPVIADDAESSALAAYGFGSFPAFTLIDADGIVRHRVTGELPMADLDAKLAEFLGLE